MSDVVLASDNQGKIWEINNLIAEKTFITRMLSATEKK